MKSRLFTTFVLSTTLIRAQVLLLDIEKRPGRRLVRRAGTVEEVISNDRQDGGYFSTVSIGTPGQKLSLQLDTGSSDLWVPWAGARICDSECDRGSFNPSDSSTYVDTGVSFSVLYVDGDSAYGNYFNDRIQIGGSDSAVDNFTMGLAQVTDINYGLAGVGYPSNEASEETAKRSYANLPIALKNAGIIGSVTYSLWLNDLDASQGSILFGGIDTEKYVGNLTWVDIIKDKQLDAYLQFSIPLTEIDISSAKTFSTDTEVILDSGTTLCYLPQDLAEELWKEVGAIWDVGVNAAVLPCSFAGQSEYLSFAFDSNGPRINVTMDELVLPYTRPSIPFRSGIYKGQALCLFGIQNSTGPYLLGDTFLRSAYVVYDLENNQIGLAATNFNATKSNVVPLDPSGMRQPPEGQGDGDDDENGAPGRGVSYVSLFGTMGLMLAWTLM